jgi:hypothetical protein
VEGHQQVDAGALVPLEHHALGEELGVDLLQALALAPGCVGLAGLGRGGVSAGWPETSLTGMAWVVATKWSSWLQKRASAAW